VTAGAWSTVGAVSSADRTWDVEVHVREDATSMFVPAAELPDAVVGDQVSAPTEQGRQRRVGRIVDVVDDDTRGRFFTVEFEQP